MTEREQAAEVEELSDDEMEGVEPTSKLRWALTELGNGERLAQTKGRDMRYVPELKGWVVWNGQSWIEDADDLVAASKAKEVVKEMKSEAFKLGTTEGDGKHLFANYIRTSSSKGISSMLKLARSEPGIPGVATDFDADPQLLACKNGTLELGKKGAKFRSLQREDYCTLNTCVDYKDDATHYVWDEFLDKFLPDEDERRWLQVLMGHMLLGGNPHRLLLLVLGDTTSGKTFLMEAIKNALGRYAGPFQLQMFRAKQDSDLNAELARALPRRLVVAEETSTGWHLHADEIKKLTGETMAVARLPHAGRAIERMPAFTPVLVSNSVPTIDGADGAMKRRTFYFPMRVSVSRSEEKVSRRNMIQAGGAALPAVLAWLVEGYNMYVAAGSKCPEIPATAIEFQFEQTTELNDVERFINDCYVRDGETLVPAADVWTEYQAWCLDNDVKESLRLSQPELGRRLQGAGIVWKNHKVDGKTVRHRIGIKPRTGGDRVTR